MIKFAKENAKRAGLYEEIDFQVLPLNFVKFGEKN
jgi:23S rRNA G2445 N2-methylase RlmL